LPHLNLRRWPADDCNPCKKNSGTFKSDAPKFYISFMTNFIIMTSVARGKINIDNRKEAGLFSMTNNHKKYFAVSTSLKGSKKKEN
jgi:hypothetical protein